MSPREIVEEAIRSVLAVRGSVAPEVLADADELGEHTRIGLTYRERLRVVEQIETVLDGEASTRLGDAWHARTVGELVRATARAMGSELCDACAERLPAWGGCIYCEAVPRRAA